MVSQASSWHPPFAFTAVAASVWLSASAPLTRQPGAPAPAASTPISPVAHAAPPGLLVPADLLRVIDGDTVEVRALIWLDQHVTTRVRLRGIDAPERNARCPGEARKAEAAAEALERTLGGRRLYLSEIGRDKYGGRVLARIVTGEGDDVGRALLAAGHARPYGGRARSGWC
jgi:micrococcal nuclease